MSTPLLIVDAFTERPFAGNPAAVCLLDTERPVAWMQALAQEMNLSETAFVRAMGDEFQLRWFTPNVEVELCGHATLAAAHALWLTGSAPTTQPIRFRSCSGPLVAARDGDWIALDFPATPPQPTEAPAGLAKALGVAPVFVGRSRFDYLVQVADANAVRRAVVDIAALRRVPVRGVILTARAEPEARGDYDFVSRFFAPTVGVDEDPVTGSAHCALGPHWASELGVTEVTGYQASPRGGTVRVVVRGDRVELRGRAVAVVRGELSAAALHGGHGEVSGVSGVPGRT